jgi:hypothetical protein
MAVVLIIHLPTVSDVDAYEDLLAFTRPLFPLPDLA